MHRTNTTLVLATLALIACGGAQEGAATPATATATSSAGSNATPAGNATPATGTAALPAAIQTPAGQSLLLKASAKGVQIYACKPKADAPTTFEWSLKAPEADLVDETGKKLGTHYAGPTWEAVDGSKVVGQKKAQADATEAGAVPWLLLEAKSNSGKGAFEHVQSVQRIATSGGKAPADGCDAAHAAAEVRVPYTATYVFNGTH